ncbi:MAG: DUF1295 domain-containing protein [Planctomycetaceae bacterium]|nr:DUF1295 domain-containing protein [Planctomycetaceae bacterium]
MTPVTAIFVGWAAMAVLMGLLWIVQRLRGDAGIVDVAWALGVGLLTILFAIFAEGDSARRAVVTGLVIVWSSRLAGYILIRLFTLPEDGRYQNMKATLGAGSQRVLFAFFQMQAFWSVLFALPMWLVFRRADPFPAISDGIGLAIWLVAALGEATADAQLARFRRDPTRKGQVCRDGLWYYSRHPNYFFEWLHWWAYVAFAWGAPLGWLTLLGPAGMLFFLTKVTGIPPTEAQALRSRGDAYREYQRTTSAFFPWPPKAH